MDQRIADGLAAGRVQFRTGKTAAAIATWKDALRVAYETQHHAAAFVLTKNLGDATLVSNECGEAIAYFDYALQLLAECGLQEEYAFFPPLENVVQYIQRRRRRAKRMLDAQSKPVDAVAASPADENHEIDAADEYHTIDAGRVCTTCELPGRLDNPIVVDEADGCPYCQSCFDAYYAEAEADENEDSASLTEDVEETLEENIDAHSGQEEVAVSASMEKKDESCESDDAVEEDVNDMDIAAVDDVIDSSLTASGSFEEDHHGDALHSSTTVAAVDTVSTIESTRGDEHLDQAAAQDNERTPSTQDDKVTYSIQELLSLRRSDLPCPNELRGSTVLANGTTQSSQPSKKSSNKSVKRPVTSESDVQAPLPSSLLPTVAECHAARASLPSMPSPLALASALFDTVPENPVSVATSFSTQLQVFASGC